MANLGTLNPASIDSTPSFSNAISKELYDSNSTALKTIDIVSASSADKTALINYYTALIGFLNGTVSATDYAAALSAITKYVLTADDYTKLRDGEISVKDLLKDVLQNEMYSTTPGSLGYYTKLAASLQTIITDINTNLITPLNNNFAAGTFFPSGTIDEKFFSPEIQKEIDNFSAGNTVITSTFTGAITSTTDIGDAAKTAATSYTAKPSVIIISQ